MTRQAKTELELRLVGHLAERVAGLKGAILTPLTPPEPDVLAEVGERRIGIEVTEMLGDHSGRRQEAEQDGIVERAKALYESAGRAPVIVSVHWSETCTLQKSDRALAEELCAIIEANIPKLGESVALGVGPGIDRELVHRAFDAIMIHRIAGVDENAWDCPRSWWGHSVDCGFIQRQIERKNGKRSGYRGSYDECWIMLFHSGFEPSSGYDLPADLLEREFASTYDKVVVLSGPGGRALFLNTALRSVSPPAT